MALRCRFSAAAIANVAANEAQAILRIGVVGAGNIGRQHIANLLCGEIPGATLQAVCARSLNLTSAHGELELPPEVQLYRDHTEMLASPDIDLVLVATPTLNHKQLGLEVLHSGKHLLMEKPLAMTLLEADELLQQAKQNKPGQQFAVVLNQRFDPAYSRIKRIVDDGELGDIQRIAWTLSHWYRPEIYFKVSDWRGTWRGEGGGLLLNQCIHNLDILQWIFGLPTELWASCGWGKYHDIEVEDEVNSVLRFENGITGTFVASSGEAPGINQLDIVGDKGTLRYDGQQLHHHQLAEGTQAHSRSTAEMFSQPQCTVTEVQLDAGPQQHAALLREFCASIHSGTESSFSPLEAAKSVELADAMLLSAWTGQRVSLPVDRDHFAAEFEPRMAGSSLREKQDLDVSIDLQKSFR